MLRLHQNREDISLQFHEKGAPQARDREPKQHHPSLEAIWPIQEYYQDDVEL